VLQGSVTRSDESRLDEETHGQTKSARASQGSGKHPEPVQSLLEPIEQDIHGPDVENATIDEMQDEVEVVESSNDHNSMLKLLENGRIEDTL
jgi:hypothetical protein